MYSTVSANLFQALLTNVCFYLELKYLSSFFYCYGNCFPIVMVTKNKKKQTGFNFIEDSIVKIKGLYILPFDKKHFLRKLVTWTTNYHYTPLPHPMPR